MPKTVARSSKTTRHHSNLRPKHKHTKDYLKVYWPYMPLITIVIAIMAVISPWQHLGQNKNVLAYATNVSASSLLDSTNKERAKSGEDNLELNQTLSKAAQAKAEDMVARNYWSHNTPENNMPWGFIVKAGYDYQKAGENLAYGFDSSEQVVAGWMNSPSHKKNMLDSIFSEVGFGFASSDNYVGKGESTVVVAMYARPTSQPITAATLDTSDTVAEVASKKEQSIGFAQMITGGTLPWLPYAIGFIAGISVTYLFLKHAVGFKRRLINGERFLVKHPLLDSTLIAFVVLAFLLIREAGVIL